MSSGAKLPKQCLYQNKIETSYARCYNSSVAPTNTSDYNFGETIKINIPTSYNTVMSAKDTMVKFNINISSAGAAAAAGSIGIPGKCYFNRCGAYGTFQKIRIIHGGTLLSEWDNINVLLDMLITSQLSSDIVRNKMDILALTGDYTGASLIDDANDPYRKILTSPGAVDGVKAPVDLTIPVCMPLVCMLSLSNNYIPLFALTGSSIELEFQLVSSLLQLINANTKQPVAHSTKKFISDFELVTNLMELSDTGMRVISESIGNGPLQWVVQDYKSVSNTYTLGTTETTVSMSVSAKYNSLNSLFFTFRDSANASGVATFSATESLYYNLSEYYLRVGAKTIPYKPPNSIPEFLSEHLRALGSVSDVNHECNIRYAGYAKPLPTAVGAAGSALTPLGSFYVGMDLESYSNTPLNDVYSGLNTTTDDIFAYFKFKGQANAQNIRIDSFALYDALIIIQNGKCSVQF